MIVNEGVQLSNSVSSDLLEKIIALGDKNRATLGFMPIAAFRRFSEERQIITAVSGEGDLLGYILYRPTKGRLSITHCCVDNVGRGAGVGLLLVGEVIQIAENKGYSSVFLKCRTDYGIDDFWSKCGFIKSHSQLGRSKNGSILNVWVYTISGGELFSWAGKATEVDQSKISVAFDLNVFIDLCGRRGENSESCGLLADWLEDEAVLCHTSVLKDELSKSSNAEERVVQLEKLTEFSSVEIEKSRLEVVKESLLRAWPIKIEDENDQYDFEHICAAVALDIDVFVTRDEELLRICDKISHEITTKVCRPGDLIGDIHEGLDIERKSLLRVEGLEVYENLLSNTDELRKLVECNAHRSSESRRHLEAKLRDFIAHPKEVSTFCLRSTSNKVEAIYTFRHISEKVVEIELLRLANDIDELVICQKALRSRVESVATQGSEKLIKITDPIAVEEYRETLVGLGFFIGANNIALKLSIGMVMSKSELSEYIDSSLSQFTEFATALKVGIVNGSDEDIVNLETVLFPLKIEDAGLPCYLVPIQPQWARELFDDEIAAMDIFAPQKLGTYCNFENAYYHRSGINMKYPSRVLWYISGGDAAQKHLTQGVRHTSLVMETRVGTAKELYKMFRHLGVYEWRDVYAAAKQNLTEELKAFRFCSTGKLPEMCSKEHFTDIGICGPIQTVREITEEQYFQIYKNSK